jgi:hypothetical protein
MRGCTLTAERCSSSSETLWVEVAEERGRRGSWSLGGVDVDDHAGDELRERWESDALSKYVGGWDQ